MWSIFEISEYNIVKELVEYVLMWKGKLINLIVEFDMVKMKLYVKIGSK